MVHETKTRLIKKEQNKSSKKRDEQSRKKKNNQQSDSDENSYFSESETEDEEQEDEMDSTEYRKFLSKIFPSKHLDKKIKAGKNLKKVLKKDLDIEEESSEDSECEEEEEKVTKKNKKKTTSKKQKVKSPKKDKKNKTKKESEDEAEEEYSSDSEESEVVVSKKDKKSEKVNIIFTIGGDKYDDEYDDEYDDDEEWEDMSDYETENEDDPLSDDSSSSEEDDDDDEEEEEEEQEIVKVKKEGKNTKPKKVSKKVDLKEEKEDVTKNNNEENNQLIVKGKSILNEKVDNYDSELLKQLNEIYEKNKENKAVLDCIQLCEQNIKKNKKKIEKKEQKYKDRNARIFKKIIKDKNVMNDYTFFEKLDMENQKKIIKELKEINKITRVEKPYRITLLESNIPTLFKGAAMKKINSLRYMEPGSGEYYKIKNWVDTFMKIPFDKYQTLPINISDGVEKCHDFMESSQKILDNAVHGLNDAKMQIMQMLGQLITNPNALGSAIAIQGPPGTGKCLVKDTPILMYDGSIKMVQDIKVGDLLMGDDSTSRNVLSLGYGQDDLYDIVPVKGEKYGVNSEHILCLKSSGLNKIKKIENKNNTTSYKVEYLNNKTYKINSKSFNNFTEAQQYCQTKKEENEIIEIPVKTLLELPNYISSKLKGYSVGVDFPHKPVPFDPYIIGTWLGDGTSSKSEITNQDSIVLHYLRSKLQEYNLNLTYYSGYTYRIGYDLHRKDRDSRNNKNIFLQVLKDLNLLNNKHIPTIYKINERNIQLELLAGLIDTDGSYSNKDKIYEITQKNKQLSDDILFLVRSLGFTAYQNKINSSCVYKDEIKKGIYYKILISGNNLHEIPVKILRKKVTEKRLQIKNTTVTGIKIIYKGFGDYYGFELDGNHRYLLGNFTVTHNTSLVKEGISKILNRPFAFIALGGATDSSFLEGHSYTYEGSTWGKIVQILLDSKCMNPVIYFDELDKISETPKGEEIAGILTHLTDSSQNNQFHDKYFAEIDFDLSKCLFIFSYNDESKINPILKDRMYRIHTKGYNLKQKTIISNNYLLPKIREQVLFTNEDIIIPDETLHYIIDNFCSKEEGVRNLKRCLEIIYTKLNLYRLMKPGSNLFEQDMSIKVEFPFQVTKSMVDKLIKIGKEENMSYKALYI
jgi:ATP-dependent Lon protease